ncbi:MAG TPA: uroporphyrinogen decarboxylase family protein [Methylomusa anaerophila]|uniref:Uroporphyrinogen decarboxylase n=1 Tax=Methylomusa anaerophila TaxID=1930071 RepID=A0A348AHI8_9FIRM|nr:uroporphyrinogen decarboxylase family protein [Methylomusa anaerophila]BBB90536.1 uroporphyrinogen decarboxylase [Methylomusa anaerophila]HML89824.1 uroporphyrinogen decarboxylase family protein [Methylomusa anaerophila]
MFKDQITPLERLTAYNKNEAVDRLPCIPSVGNGAARVIGAKISQFRNNGALIAKAQVESYKLFQYDVVRIFTDLYVQAEAMGAKVMYPLDETAHLESPAIKDIADIGRLQPPNPYKDGQLPEFLSAMKIALDEVGREVGVIGSVTCPFTTASFLIGTEQLTKLMLRDPQAAHKLCEIALDANLQWAQAILDTGCGVTLSDPVASSTLISPKQFREFAFPYLKRLISYINSRGKSATLHICGKTNKIWEDMVETGAACLSLDNVIDMAAAKERVGAKVRLTGNVDPSAIMLQGSVADVKQAVIDCVAKTFDSPKGYIVASGCSLPTEVPFENIHAMMNTVREIGYPVTQDKLTMLRHK